MAKKSKIIENFYCTLKIARKRLGLLLLVKSICSYFHNEVYSYCNMSVGTLQVF